MKFQKSEGWLAALLLGLWAVLNERVLFQGHSFVLAADTSSIFYPLWKWGGEVFRSGRIPLWCPDSACGTPYLADPTLAVWYPVKYFLYRFFDPTTAFTVLVAGHSLWALAGFWLLARIRGFSPWAAFWGCLVWGFSFNSLVLPWCASMALAMAWTPWVFASFEMLWKRRKEGWFFFAGATALQWSAGYPLFGFLTLLLLGLDVSARTLLEKQHLSRGVVLESIGALGLAAFFNAAWILPFLEFLPYSNFSLRLAMPSANPWGDLATWFNPLSLGHPFFSSSITVFLFRVYFVGLPTLAIVLHGAVTRRVSWRAITLWATVLLLSLGETAWAGGWLKAFIPGYHWVVRSGYWLPFMVMVAALGSMEAVESFVEGKKGPGIRFSGWFLCLGVYGAALLLGVPWNLETFWVSLGLLLLFYIPRLGPNVRAALLCAALVFSLGPLDRNIHFTMDRSFYDSPPPLAGQLRLPGRLYQSPDWVDAHRVISGNSVGDVYSKFKSNLVPNWPLSWGLRQVGYDNTLFPMSFLRWYDLPSRTGKEASRKILDYLGVRYAMGLPQLAPPVGKEVWEDPSPMPLWFTVQRASVEKTWEEDLARIEDPRFDLGKDCLIERSSQAGTYSQRKVIENSRNANEVLLAAEGQGRALLVSSELAYPGWWGRVGGNWRPLETVNHDFRGLVLEAGETQAEVVYRPLSFRLGCFLSLIALALWGGWGLRLLVMGGRKRERY